MTATYTNQPGVRDVDTVRMLINDRDTIPATDAALSDEEIQFFVDNNSHIYLAAADAALAVGANYADGAVVKKVGDLQIEFGMGRTGTYQGLAKALRLQAARKAKPFAGGLTESGKDTAAADTDRVHPAFTVGGMDHQQAGEGTDRGVIDY